MSYVISHPDVEGEPAVIPERALPVYAAKGWVLDGRIVANTPPPAPRIELELPTRSASAAEWKTYAVVQGMDFDVAMAKTRDELADQYAPAPAPEPKRPQRNDSTESWRAYAVTRGLDSEQADALSRDGDDGLIAYIDQLDADHLDQTQES